MRHCAGTARLEVAAGEAVGWTKQGCVPEEFPSVVSVQPAEDTAHMGDVWVLVVRRLQPVEHARGEDVESERLPDGRAERSVPHCVLHRHLALADVDFLTISLVADILGGLLFQPILGGSQVLAAFPEPVLLVLRGAV